jgi:hypothetical protein
VRMKEIEELFRISKQHDLRDQMFRSFHPQIEALRHLRFNDHFASSALEQVRKMSEGFSSRSSLEKLHGTFALRPEIDHAIYGMSRSHFASASLDAEKDMRNQITQLLEGVSTKASAAQSEERR